MMRQSGGSDRRRLFVCRYWRKRRDVLGLASGALVRSRRPRRG